MYDFRLFERDKRMINTVIIYSSNSKRIQNNLNIGVGNYTPQVIKMKDYDGDIIYNKLKGKIKNDIAFDDLDVVNLLFIPLMKSKQSKSKMAVKSINLARNIKDRFKQNMCIGSIFAFAYRYLNETEIKDILEVLKMTDLATILLHDRDKEIAKKALQKGLDIETIRDLTDLDIETIKELQKEIDKE